MSLHTKLPWTARKAQIGSAWVVYAPDDFPIVFTHGNTSTKGLKRAQAGVMQADAEFIVRACNSHDDLVKALQGVIRVADRATAEFDAARAALVKAGAA